MINFELKQNITKEVIDKRNLNKMIIEEEILAFPEGKRLIDEMIVNLNVSKEFSKQPGKIVRGEDNWYKYSGIVMKRMAKDYPESKKYVIPFLVAHMMELLLFDEKLDVMNYLYSLESIKQDSFEWFAKDYFDGKSIITKNFNVFIMYKLNKRQIMVLNKENKWIEATPEDQREIASSKEAKDFLSFNASSYNNVVGFIGYEKKNRYMAFKTKDMNSKRDTGARCDEASKTKNMAKLNEIVGEEKFTNETLKAVKDKDGDIVQEAVGNYELCVMEEFILRYFNEIGEKEKKWFLTPEMAIYNKLYTIFV